MALADMPGDWTVLGWWWNGNLGESARRDVWLEQSPGGTFRLRWREGPIESSLTRGQPADVLAALKELLGEDKGDHWHEQVYLAPTGQVRNHHRPAEYLDGTPVKGLPAVPATGSAATPEA